MKDINYLGFTIYFETQHNGSILATAIGDNQTIKMVYYFYPKHKVINSIKTKIRETLQNA